ALDQIEVALAFATDHGFFVFIAFGRVIRGWILVQQGQLQAGIEELHTGLASIGPTGKIAFEPFAHAPLIEAYGKTGQFEMGLQMVTEALQFADRHDNRFLEAEIHRLKGELLLAQESREYGTPSKEQKPENPN